jgi:DNA-binding CsgD family transcriptional regulator
MSTFVFSSGELQQLARAMALLLDPFGHEHPDDWRRAVNRLLLPLLNADSAGFLLPGVGGMPMFSEEHDQKQLAVFPESVPPPTANGTPIWKRMLDIGVGTLVEAYDGDISPYYASAYYNDYAAANRACETLSAQFSLGGTGPHAAASLHFWHNRLDDDRAFGEREVAMLRLLLPAFRAGVESQLRFGAHRRNLLHMLDGLGHAVLVLDACGRVVHRTPALVQVLEGDAGRDDILCAMRRAAMVACGCVAMPETCATRCVTTDTARYRITVSTYGCRGDRDAAVLVALERRSSRVATEAELRERFTLTPAESRVALLLATGQNNADIAAALGITSHTARRHTERVLRKLGVRSRAEVAGRVYR